MRWVKNVRIWSFSEKDSEYEHFSPGDGHNKFKDEHIYYYMQLIL